MRPSSVVAAVGCLALAVTLTSAPAQAHSRPDRSPQTVAEGLAGPLTVAAGHHGSAYVTQSFAGTLSAVTRRGTVSTVHQLRPPVSPDAPNELVGVDVDGRSTFHLETDFGRGPSSHLVKTTSRGHRSVVSRDFLAYEEAENPDARVRYGLRGLDDTCAAEVAVIEEATGLPLNRYRGVVESHAYQVDVHGRHAYVADAAANAILKVNLKTRKISTVAVLPATTITVTEELKAGFDAQLGAPASGLALPQCVVGADYTVEPVPTDVRVGRDGQLYVSTLQGSAGEIVPLSKVYRIDPRSGRARTVATGLHGATGLDVTARGDIVVAEMFGGEVSVIRQGSHRAKTLFAAGSPGDVSVSGSTVYATTGVFDPEGNGALVSYRYR